MKTSLSQNFIFFSKKLQDSFFIRIALPEGYDQLPDKEHTSIYLLDANYFFDEKPGTLEAYLVRGEGMTKIVQSLTANGNIPSSILVGIGYTEEQREKFTIDDVKNFHEFFTDELIPVIESRFKVSKTGKDRVLFGYSSSAHFSTYALMYDALIGTETFNKFISVSGVYDHSLEAYKLEEKIFKEFESNVFSGKSLFIGVGADDANLDLLGAHRAFSEKLVGRGYPDFKIYNKEYSGKGHYDIPEFAFLEGLICIFSA